MAMAKKEEQDTSKPRRGRPPIRIVQIDATASEIAQSIFRAAKPPDPSLRKYRKPKKS